MVTARAPLPSLESQITIVPQLLPADAAAIGRPARIRVTLNLFEATTRFTNGPFPFIRRATFGRPSCVTPRAIEFDPQTADAYVNRGAAYESMDDLNRALQDFNTALGLEPKSEAYNNRGNVYFKKRDYDRARSKTIPRLLNCNPATLAHTSIAVIHSGIWHSTVMPPGTITKRWP